MSFEVAQRHFVKRLEEIRESKGMSKQAFSEYLGLARYTYDYYVNRGGMPTLYTAMVIAAALNMTVDQLLGIKGGDST